MTVTLPDTTATGHLHQVPRLLPIKAAATELGLEYRQLLSAVNEGLVPHYRLRTSRLLVSISEVIAVMKIEGGRHDS